jgi:tripartite-type tricarboxylate transporter receptor subunit TctC
LRELPVKTVAELVALAKAQPGKFSYGHAGVGTAQLGAELFKYMAHVDIAPVPYRGTTAECKYETGSLDYPASR